MTNNAQQPISKVRTFAETAENRGCYSKSQRGNLDTAWAIFLKILSDDGVTVETKTVEEIRPLVDQAFRLYGNQNRVSTSTVRAYQTRVKRLLDDFVAHNGGDFMAWKEQLSKVGASAAKSRRRRRIEDQPVEPRSQELEEGVSHTLLLSGGRKGALTLPSHLLEADVEPVWQQLEALKTLIKAQIAAVSADAKQ